YVDAKLQAFARQHAGGVAVVPDALLARGERRGDAALSLVAEALRGDPATRVTFGEGEGADLRLAGGKLRWRDSRLMDAGEIRLRGRHNLDNAMAAAAVCLAREIEPQAVREGLSTFAGVPHRLEAVASRQGVCFVNDSKATNVASTLVALEAFPGAPLHL